MLHKCSKHSISVREIEDYYNELSRYLKSQPKETNGKRVKSLEKRRRKRVGTGIKILTSNKLLTRFPILLVQIKAGNNSIKLKNETKQILYLLYQHIKITKKPCNNLIKSL